MSCTHRGPAHRLRFPLARPGLALLTGLVVLTSGCPAAGVVDAAAAERVSLVRTPGGGIQPQAAVDARGNVHLVYLKGDPRAADIFYVRQEAGKQGWSQPLRVNSRPGSAVAAGTIRGAHLALGKGGRVHVAWFGASERPAPMLYSRLNDAGDAFEPQRNLMTRTFGLDGGGSIAADASGSVYVTWHANGATSQSEQERRLWVARSPDEGKTFSRETAVYAKPTGACVCCGVKAFADNRGTVYVLYRSASTKVDRDMYLLVSRDRGERFGGELIHPWKVPG